MVCNHLITGVATGDGAVHNIYPKVSKGCKVDHGPGSEVVVPVLKNVAEFAAHLDGMPALYPGQRVRQEPRSVAAVLAVAISERPATEIRNGAHAGRLLKSVIVPISEWIEDAVFVNDMLPSQVNGTLVLFRPTRNSFTRLGVNAATKFKLPLWVWDV